IHADERLMDYWAIGSLIDWAAAKKASGETKNGLRAELDKLAADFAGPSPTPTERVLAQTAAISWFAFRLHEVKYVGSVTSESGMSLQQSEQAQRRMERAHRRMLSTLKTLATIRRLAIPALQINVARQQVNQVHAGGTP